MVPFFPFGSELPVLVQTFFELCTGFAINFPDLNSLLHITSQITETTSYVLETIVSVLVSGCPTIYPNYTPPTSYFLTIFFIIFNFSRSNKLSIK